MIDDRICHGMALEEIMTYGMITEVLRQKEKMKLPPTDDFTPEQLNQSVSQELVTALILLNSIIPMSDIDMELEEANGGETMRIWRKMDFIKFNEACNKLAIAIADLRPELEV